MEQKNENKVGCAAILKDHKNRKELHNIVSIYRA